MFIQRYLLLNLFFSCDITFHFCYGLLNILEYRKKIYDAYCSSYNFEGEWKDPYFSLGINDDRIKFDEELENSYTIYHKETVNREDEYKEAWKSPESISGNRILPKNKLRDGMDIGGILENESNTIFFMARNLVTVSTILSFVVVILFLCFPKTLVFMFTFIVSVLWHWMKLYQEKIAEKQNVMENLRHPNECRRSDLLWYETIYLYLFSYVSSETDCKEYYKAQLVDPFWEVSLPLAIMNALATTVCEPMKVLATTVRFCLKVIFGGLTLLELTIALFSVFLFLAMWFRYSLGFFWGAISIYPAKNYSVDQTASQSISFWGSIKRYIRALFFGKSPLIRPPELDILPENKKDVFSDKMDKIKNSDKGEFHKQEKSTDNVQQSATLPPRCLKLEKNYYRMEDLKIPQFKKNKKSFSC